jgi:dihydropteroate synthase
MHWQLGNQLLDCSQPLLMAIVNVTPDSFYSGSRFAGTRLGEQLESVIADQPDILDIGGQSTRPGSPRLSPDDELARVIPALQTARELAPGLPVTVDTYSARVAREALAAGADGINDISAGSLDPELIEVVAGNTECGYVLMHMQGTPETMQLSPHYNDVISEVHNFFAGKLADLNQRGIESERVVVDPGIGFGKRLEDNLNLIRHAGDFADLGRPLLYGVSRKSFIKAIDTHAVEADQRLPGSLALTYELLERGVRILRVHDTSATRQVIKVWNAVHSQSA